MIRVASVRDVKRTVMMPSPTAPPSVRKSELSMHERDAMLRLVSPVFLRVPFEAYPGHPGDDVRETPGGPYERMAEAGPLRKTCALSLAEIGLAHEVGAEKLGGGVVQHDAPGLDDVAPVRHAERHPRV